MTFLNKILIPKIKNILVFMVSDIVFEFKSDKPQILFGHLSTLLRHGKEVSHHHQI